MIFEKRNIDHPFRSFFPPIICGDCLLYASDLVHCGKCSYTRMRGSGPIRLHIRTAIPFLIRAGEGRWQPGSHGMAFAPHFSAGNRRGPGGPLRMAFHPHFPGRGPPEKRSLRGSWRQTTRSFGKEPAVNISIATDAAGSALPSKERKKVRQSDPLPAASFTLRSPPPAPFPARPKKFGPSPHVCAKSCTESREHNLPEMEQLCARFFLHIFLDLIKIRPSPGFFRFPHIL
jgi:hypothetical protein